MQGLSCGIVEFRVFVSPAKCLQVAAFRPHAVTVAILRHGCRSLLLPAVRHNAFLVEGWEVAIHNEQF